MHSNMLPWPPQGQYTAAVMHHFQIPPPVPVYWAVADLLLCNVTAALLDPLKAGCGVFGWWSDAEGKGDMNARQWCLRNRDRHDGTAQIEQMIKRRDHPQIDTYVPLPDVWGSWGLTCWWWASQDTCTMGSPCDRPLITPGWHPLLMTLQVCGGRRWIYIWRRIEAATWTLRQRPVVRGKVCWSVVPHVSSKPPEGIRLLDLIPPNQSGMI